MRLRPYALRLLRATVKSPGIDSATAGAGPIDFLGDPIITAPDGAGGFLLMSPSTPAGNPASVTNPMVVELRNCGSLDDFRINGMRDFIATGGTRYGGVRERDDLAIFHAVGSLNTPEEDICD